MNGVLAMTTVLCSFWFNFGYMSDCARLRNLVNEWDELQSRVEDASPQERSALRARQCAIQDEVAVRNEHIPREKRPSGVDFFLWKREMPRLGSQVHHDAGEEPICRLLALIEICDGRGCGKVWIREPVVSTP